MTGDVALIERLQARRGGLMRSAVMTTLAFAGWTLLVALAGIVVIATVNFAVAS